METDGIQLASIFICQTSITMVIFTTGEFSCGLHHTKLLAGEIDGRHHSSDLRYRNVPHKREAPLNVATYQTIERFQTTSRPHKRVIPRYETNYVGVACSFLLGLINAGNSVQFFVSMHKLRQ